MAGKQAKWSYWRGICASAALSLIGLLIAHPWSAAYAGPGASSPLGPLPPGWSLSITDVLAIYSPATATGAVTVVVPPAVTAKGDARSAIIEEAPALIEDLFGEPRPAGNPVPLPASDGAASGLLVPLTVELEDGSQARIEATGYSLPGGKLQLFFLAAPSSMPDDDTALRTARTLVDQWRAAGLVINESLTPELGGRGATLNEQVAATDTGAAIVSGEASIADDKVENVIQYLRFPFDGSNPASAGEPVTVTALLLRDGRVFESEASAPGVFDPSSRPPGSAGTGRWRRDGEAYALAFTDGTQGTAVSAAAKTLAAPASLLLSGKFAAAGGEPAELLPDTIEFYPDGSLLLKDQGEAFSGAYEITGRTARITVPGREPGTFLFGFRGELARPVLIVLGNRIYERQTAAP